jgi:hypothetical protein
MRSGIIKPQNNDYGAFMIRLGENIRLTASERDTLSTVVGFQANPKTVAQHDALLSNAAADFEEVVAQEEPALTADGNDANGVAEARLMAAVLKGMQLAD